MTKYPEEIKLFIKNNVKGLTNKDLTELVNEKFNTDYTVLQIDGYKSRNHLSSGLTGHFEKGHVPSNKGKHMSEEQYKKCAATMFKKGHVSDNKRPVGSERVTVDGYIEVKTANPKTWRLKHNVIWEEKNGKIPPKHCIIFLDGDKQNLNIENLCCISRAVHKILNKNKLRSTFPEITASNIANTQLKIAIKNTEKRGDG